MKTLQERLRAMAPPRELASSLTAYTPHEAADAIDELVVALEVLSNCELGSWNYAKEVIAKYKAKP
jgi:2-keto-4-pentenoate hydratase